MVLFVDMYHGDGSQTHEELQGCEPFEEDAVKWGVECNRGPKKSLGIEPIISSAQAGKLPKLL